MQFISSSFLIYRIFIAVQLLLLVTSYRCYAQQPVYYRNVCVDETTSTFRNNFHRAQRGDSECFEGQTDIFAEVDNPNIGTVTWSKIGNNGRSFGSQFTVNWLSTGTLTVTVKYQRWLSRLKWKWYLGIFVVECYRTGKDVLHTYVITRDNTSLGAIYDGNHELAVPNNETQAVFNLYYRPKTTLSNVRATHIKYHNGLRGANDGPMEVSHPITDPVVYYATGKNTYQLRAQVLHEFLDEEDNVTCSKWIPMDAEPLRVISSCFYDDFNDIHIRPVAVNPSDVITYEKPEAFGLKGGKTYTLEITSDNGDNNFRDHFHENYSWNYNDFGPVNMQASGNSFTVPVNLYKGSYRISVTPNVTDCITPDDIPILIDIANKRVEQKCTITLPQDIKDWFREFSPNDNILQHIAGYVETERSIILNPGITLELGAELFLEYPDPIPEADDPDINMNFIEQTSYDEYGRVIASGRNYFDERGTSLQSQAKNLSAEVILANATLYDAYGRPAISTLPAPIQVSKVKPKECPDDAQVGSQIRYTYKADFVKATSTQTYSTKHFDIIDTNNSKELTPLPVNASKEGTLGWYYSANNTLEPLVATTQYPYSRTLYHHDGTSSVKGVTKPGNAFKAGSNYLATTDLEQVLPDDPYLNTTTFNSYLAIRNKELGLNNPASIDGQFFKTASTDESGNKSVTYTDKADHPIITLYFGDQSNPLTKSFNFYDNAGRIIVSISPNGMEQYTGTNYTDIDKTTYSYNSKGQLINLNEKIAGGDAINGISKTEYVYRKDGNIRFSQNEEQRRASPPRYSYTNYDKSGRPIESGEYSMISATIGIGFKTNEMMSVLESTNANGGLPEAGDSEATTNNIGVKRERTFTYYDVPDPSIPINTDLNIDRTQHFLNGAVSHTKKVNYNPDLLPDEDHFISWYSYDERGRVEWIIQDITGLGTKTIDYRYGPTGQVQDVTYQRGHDREYVNGKDQFVHFYEYDADGRLKKVYTSRELLVYNIEGKLINAGVTYNEVTGELNNPGLLELQATYYYYIHGPLKRVELANKLQGIDYVYTADGALKGINNASASTIPNPITSKIKDPGQDGNGNGFRKDVFGMSIDYYQNDFVSADGNAGASIAIPGNADLYNGLIKATRWHSPTEPGKQFVYAYEYDKRNQFKQANWGEIDLTGKFESSALNYLEAVKSDGGFEGYDANGNIKRLKRYAGDGTPIADFSYNYRTYTNILESISQGNETFRTYTYDNLGRTVKEQEGDKLKFITYDVTGKVIGVYADNSHTKPIATFVYDDKGFRLSKTIYDNELHKGLLRTWYIRDASGNVVSNYEESLEEIKPIKLSEIPVYGSGRIGMYNNAGIMLYELTDNLGNVRAVIGGTITAEYLATMEEGELADVEVNDYEFNIKRSIAPEKINHTPKDFTVDGNNYHIENPNQVNRINNKPLGASNPDPIGTGIMLNVHPGDVISTEVFAKYASFESTDHNIVTGLASFLTTTFSSPWVIKDAIFNIVNTAEFNALPAWKKLNDTQPHAFLNYLLFDNNFKLQKFDFDQVTSTAQIPTSYPYVNNHERLALDNITIEKEGFIYIYVSNQSDQNMDVYFDDLKVTYTSSDIVGGGDFYPYGLSITDRQITRDPYRHGYQGKFSEKDDETGWNHFEFREYDPVVGRWTRTDPKRSNRSPYQAMLNNPILYSDPDGRDVIILNNKNGGNGFGHAAILVSKGGVWYLYSKNGTATHGVVGESFDYQDGKAVGSLDDFFNGEFNKDEKGNTLYDRALLIHTDAQTDAAIMEAASKEVKSYYKAIGASCQDVWNCALDKAGLGFYQGFWPNDDFWFMKNFMTMGDKVERLPVPSVEFGPLIPLKEGEVFNPDNYED